MKTISLTFTFVLLTLSGYCQAKFQVISNPCDPTLEKSYYFEYADSMLDWGSPVFTDPNNAIQGELVFVNDGSTPGVFTSIGTPPILVETTTDACEDTAWTQDLTGKIAVTWRGTCEFGCKAEKAQSRGAIGVIIVDHTGEAPAMSGGTCGLNVTIPVISISRNDGESLMNCINGGGVIAFIGNDNGAFPNDVGSSKSEILMTESSAIPWDLARNGVEYPVDFGLWVRNKGANPQNGVTATVVVTYNGSTVYTQTSVPLNFNVLDTQYIDLGTFAPVAWNVGTYHATYTITNANDQFLPDNTFSFEFKFTDNEDVYAKSRLDNLNQPIHNMVTSIHEFYDCDYEVCIAFKNEYAGTRNAMALGMTLSSSPVNPTIENSHFEIRAYQWNDVFTDINSPVTFNNLSLLDSLIYTYLNDSLIDSNIYLPFNSPIALQDNQRYLFCAYYPHVISLRLRTGIDSQLDYTTTQSHYLQPIIQINVSGQNHEFIKVWADGLMEEITPAISVTMDITTNINETKAETTSYPYPNPATNLLTVPLRKSVNGSMKIKLFDLNGKLVLSEIKSVQNEPLQLNVASIANGNYLLKLSFSDGSSDVFKVSVNR